MAKSFGLGAFLLAGAAQGVGTGLVEEAKAKREAALKEMERKFQLQRDDTRHARDLELKKMDQGFRSEESAREREFRAGEAAKDRETRGYEYGTTPEGETMAIRGTKAETVTNERGEPVRGIDRYKPSTGSMSETEKRLRFTEGLNAGKPSTSYGSHDWGASVRTWKALGIPPSDPRVVEFVQDDLKAQAGKNGLRGREADAWVAEQMNTLGLVAPGAAGRKGDRSENLRAPGDNAPRRATVGETIAERPERIDGGGRERIDRAFDAFPNAGRAAAAPAAAAQPAPAAGDARKMAALAKAREAITRGVSRDAVIQRLRDANIDPAGL